MATESGAHGDEEAAVSGEGIDPRFDPRFQRGFQDGAAEAPAAQDARRPEQKRGPGIDPRFDARFQRGYDPERHEQMRRPVSADEVDDRPAFASTVKAGIPRPIDTPISRPAARTPVQPASSVAGAASVSPRVPEITDLFEDAHRGGQGIRPETAVSGRNPFLIALWVACTALVVVGVALIVQTATTTSGGGFGISAFGDAFGVTAWAIAPVTVMVGLIGLVALTLSRALGWLAAHPEHASTAPDADPDTADLP